MDITSEYLHNLLFHEETGLLMKFHFGQGLDMEAVDRLYEALEILKADWKDKSYLPKDLVFILVDIVPALYCDLPAYVGTPEYDQYVEIFYNLSTAVSMCVNPDVNDMHFNKPLKDIGI
ncbi:hypothetical protein AAEO56_15945 [Flavobacterium sp. DGU11]|uniref:Uncharacterized protein n=1 Tax=Flavobacterium arundinis TaxID=3139143 RepID=A0ABU9I015_9FLAO